MRAAEQVRRGRPEGTSPRVPPAPAVSASRGSLCAAGGRVGARGGVGAGGRVPERRGAVGEVRGPRGSRRPPVCPPWGLTGDALSSSGRPALLAFKLGLSAGSWRSLWFSPLSLSVPCLDSQGLSCHAWEFTPSKRFLQRSSAVLL